MKSFSAVLFLGLFALAPVFAWAATKAGQPAARPSAFYLAPTVGGYSFHRVDGLGSGVLSGLKIGYDFGGSGGADTLGVEGFAAMIKPSSGEDAYQFRVDAIYPLFSKFKLTPFLALGGGWIVFDDDSGSDDVPVAAFGFGAKYALKNKLLLRADVRNVLRFESGRPNNVEYTIGLAYVFGQARSQKPVSLPEHSSDGEPPILQSSPDSPDGRARGSRTPAKDTEPHPLAPCPYPLQEGRGN